MVTRELSMEESIEIAAKFLEEGLYDVSLGGRTKNKMRKYINKVITDLQDLVEGKDIGFVGEEITSEVSECCHVISRLLLTEEHTEQLVLASESIMLLVFNWNSVVDSREVEGAVDSIQSCINYQSSALSTIIMLQKLLKEFKAFQYFNPPSYKVARGYFETIRRRLDEEGGNEEKKKSCCD